MIFLYNFISSIAQYIFGLFCLALALRIRTPSFIHSYELSFVAWLVSLFGSDN